MKKILKKTWLIAIAILFVTACFLPSISAINEAGEFKTIQTATKGDIIYWEENFDSYTVGQGLHGVNGWEGWEGNPAWDSYVTDVQSRSPANSVDIVGDSDTVRVFENIGGSGYWTFTCWVYIPSTFSGLSYFILLNTYGTGIHNWSTQLRLDSSAGVISSEFEEEQFNLVYDEWVELRVEIDFDADWQYIYYDGDLLSDKSWTAGVSGGGKLELGAVDLFANGATSVYYDDFTLVGPEPEGPDLECAGELSWSEIEAGATVNGNFTIENIGAAASELNWEIESIPDWGEWTIDPESGTGLTPEAGELTISVEVVAPDEPESDFDGKIKIVNTDDPDDFCEIEVSLATPVSQNIKLLDLIIQRFPILGKILEVLFG